MMNYISPVESRAAQPALAADRLRAQDRGYFGAF
jgi:hypothetical protein